MSSNISYTLQNSVSGAFGVCVPDWQVLLAWDGADSWRPTDCQTRQEHDRPPGRHTLINNCLHNTHHPVRPWSVNSISWRWDIAESRFSMFFAVLCNMSISVPILVWFKLVFISIFLEVAKKDWCHIVPEKDSARSGTECHQELKLAHLSLNCFEMLFAHLE